MLEIDPQFRRMGKGARKRRIRLNLLRGGGAALALLLVGGGVWLQWGDSLPLPGRVDENEIALVPVEAELQLAPIVRADTFTDIPGDPLIIPGAEGGERTGRRLVGPASLPVSRVGAPSPERLTLVSENLYMRERRLVAALPTTREEFALFQAERTRERASDGGGDTPALPGAGGDQASSNVFFTREAQFRPALWQDLLLEVHLKSRIADLMQNNGFDRQIAENVQARVAQHLETGDELPPGALLAIRYRSVAGHRQVLQLSLYQRGEYQGSLAMAGSGQLVPAADAWADHPPVSDVETAEAQGDNPQFRLLDVIYSAATRQGVPSALVGEAIALMSRVYDLDAFAAEGDKLQLVFASEPGPEYDEAGQILYIGVNGPSGNKSCYVVAQAKGGYDCYAPGARVVAISAAPSMVAPVAGVLSRRYAPPVEGEAESGSIAWKAAQGTAVVAVAEGQIAAVDKDAAGVRLTISHADQLTSVYFGLENIPDEIRVGATVKTGAMIGRVASAAKTAELGFRLLKDGKPVDPIPYLTGGKEVLASGAVETLIGRIIHVESAGNATARNPLSTASGLGQFIESTWLRMMQTYRPDLVITLSRQEVLNLRFNPDLSRQMVRNLAQENEAFLRARGHNATPGNLYLAHFLGPLGASQALSADPSAPVINVMGPAVVAANPFLRNYTIADLRNWSDRKMSGQAVAAATSVPAAIPVKAPPEVERYVAMIDGLLAQQ